MCWKVLLTLLLLNWVCMYRALHKHATTQRGQKVSDHLQLKVQMPVTSLYVR